jgi:hypothetical protein
MKVEIASPKDFDSIMKLYYKRLPTIDETVIKKYIEEKMVLIAKDGEEIVGFLIGEAHEGRGRIILTRVRLERIGEGIVTMLREEFWKRNNLKILEK